MKASFGETIIEVFMWMISKFAETTRGYMFPYINQVNIAGFAIVFAIFFLGFLIVRKLWPFSRKKWYLAVFFGCLVVSVYVTCRIIFGDGASIFIALIAGVIASIHSLVIELFFPPILDYDFVGSLTFPTGSPTSQQKWFHLLVSNKGFTSARNVRVSIRDNVRGAWVNLQRPFAKTLKERIPGEKILDIATLSSGDSDQFDFGVIYGDGPGYEFELCPAIKSNGQNYVVCLNCTHTYYIKIVAENAPPVHRMIQVFNPGFKLIEAKHFKTIKA